MRRRPFKFFFALSLGIILFFFLARIVVMAIIAAAIMSLVFFVLRKIKNFFKYMTWEEEYDFERNYRYPRSLPRNRYDDEPLFDDWDTPFEQLRRERIIEVR